MQWIPRGCSPCPVLPAAFPRCHGPVAGRQGRFGHRGAPRTLTSTLFFKNSSEATAGAPGSRLLLQQGPGSPGRQWPGVPVMEATRGGLATGTGEGVGAEGGRSPSSPTARCSPGFGPSPPAAPWRCRRRPAAASHAGSPGPPPTAAAGRAGAPSCRPRAPAPAALVSPRLASPGPRSAAAASRAPSREGDAGPARPQELMSGGAAPAPAGRDGGDQAGPPPPRPGAMETWELRDPEPRGPADLGDSHSPDRIDPGPHRARIA